MIEEFDACSPEANDETLGAEIPADEKLVAEGWQRRYLADPSRAEEAIELYSSLGYEVKAQKLTPADLGPNCGTCSEAVCRSFVLIYTRGTPKQKTDPS
ncbi:MAG: hypothetical protein GY903_03370 [Fuerstiella sp.]|nr:hypothetical protein [Fuerstiella sp.]